MNQLLTVDEISGILKITPNTIHNKKWQVRTGCPIRKVGKKIYVLHDEFWGWLKGA